MKKSHFVVLVVILLAVAACGGSSSDGSTTVAVVDTTDGGADTTSPPEQTTVPADDAGTITDISDMPAECIEAFSAFLQQIEPIVKDIDFENSTMADLEAMGNELEPISEAFEAETAACPELDISDEESIALMRELAERDAPGTAAYFAWVEQFMVGSDDGGAGVSGDCETDIAALQEFVDQGGTMADMTLGDLTTVGSLMGAVSTECTPERFQEWIEQEDVAAWTEG